MWALFFLTALYVCNTIVNLDCSGTPDNVWDQLLAIGRLMRPAAQHRQDDEATMDDKNDDEPFVI